MRANTQKPPFFPELALDAVLKPDLFTNTATMTPRDLKAWRHERGLTQAQLAAMLDITPQHLSTLENGHHPITVMFTLALVGIERELETQKETAL